MANSRAFTRRGRKIAAPVLAGALVFGVAACSKKDETSTTSTTAAASAGSTTTPKAGGSTGGSSVTTGGATGSTVAADKAMELKQTVWYDGFKYTLGAVALDAENTAATIEVEVENLLTTDQTPYPIVSVDDSQTTLFTAKLDESPQIKAKGKAKGKIIIAGVKSVDELSKADLVFGNDTQAVARVPFKEPTKAVTLKPIEQAYKQKIVLDGITFDVTKTEVRFDNVPSDVGQADKGKAYVVLWGAMSNSADDLLYIDGNGFSLSQPDGQTSTAFQSAPASLESTKKDDKAFIMFQIDAQDMKFAGTYKLKITQNWGVGSTEVSDDLEFTLTDTPATSTGGSTTTKAP